MLGYNLKDHVIWLKARLWQPVTTVMMIWILTACDTSCNSKTCSHYIVMFLLTSIVPRYFFLYISRIIFLFTSLPNWQKTVIFRSNRPAQWLPHLKSDTWPTCKSMATKILPINTLKSRSKSSPTSHRPSGLPYTLSYFGKC